jgi:hypothetical protein
MRFRSAKEDLYETTLRGCHGLLARIEYLAGLRQPSGRYEHWGMARVHGQPAVEAALEEAHVQTMNAMLRKPIAELYAESEQQAGILKHQAAELLPPATDELRAAHFNLIWGALVNVARRRASHHPSA